MNELLLPLGWTLLHFLWQGCLVALLVGLVLWSLAGRDSRIRYGVACLGLCLMVSAPTLTFFRLQGQPQFVVATASKPTTPATTSSTPIPPPAVLAGNWQALVNRSIPWLTLCWVSGCLLMSLRLAGGWVWLQWLRRRPDTHPASDSEQLLLLRLCQRMGVGSNLRLLLCAAVPGPTLLGWLKPVILIPPAMLTGLSPMQLEQILAHELAHVLRYDYLVNLLQSVAEVLFFFHPAVWWLSKQIRQEREQAADDLAVRLCGDALDYAQALTALEALTSLAVSSHPPPRLALGAHGGDFMSRIHRLISPTVPLVLAPRAGLVLLLLLGTSIVIQARSQNPPPSGPTWLDQMAKGTVQLRRYDGGSVDGKSMVGLIDMHARAVSVPTMERAIGMLKELPLDPSKGQVDLLVAADASEKGSLYNFKFTGVEPARVLAIIKGQDSLAPVQKEKGWLVIQRHNTVSSELAQVPRGLKVDVWAGAVPVGKILQALSELEAMPPTPGIPQEIRKLVNPLADHDHELTIDLQQVDPDTLRAILEAELAKPKA